MRPYVVYLNLLQHALSHALSLFKVMLFNLTDNKKS